jgi:voltage-gated potassium channel
VTTLTTTGYGDIVPVTPLGRMIAGFVMISGLAVFGLWTGILATGFAAETRRRDFVRTWEFVAKVPFYKPLSPAAIIEIARMLRPIDVAERTMIVRKGRQGDCMYFIAEGLVEVVGAGVQLGAGAFFGEMALLGDGTRTATVTAVVPTTLLVLELTDYRIFAAHYPELARAVEDEAARRRAERNKKPEPPPEPGAAAHRHATVDE